MPTRFRRKKLPLENGQEIEKLDQVAADRAHEDAGAAHGLDQGVDTQSREQRDQNLHLEKMARAFKGPDRDPQGHVAEMERVGAGPEIDIEGDIAELVAIDQYHEPPGLETKAQQQDGNETAAPDPELAHGTRERRLAESGIGLRRPYLHRVFKTQEQDMGEPHEILRGS